MTKKRRSLGGYSNIEPNKNEGKFAAGTYDMIECTLGKLVDDGKDGAEFHEVADLRDQYLTFTLSQEMTQPAMVLTITIGDGKQMFERLGGKGLQGEEFIKLVFGTPRHEKVNLLFHVTVIREVEHSEHGIGDTISLICITKEKIISDQKSISRSYNTTLSNCIKNIFKNDIQRNSSYIQMGSEKTGLWKDRKIFVDDTVGIETFIIPNLQPFNAINWCCNRAFGGSETPGSHFRFFENNKGFHFANIEKIIDPNGNGSVGEIPMYTYDPMQGDSDFRSAQFFRSIEALSPVKMPNMNSRINNGTLKHRVRTIDVISQTHDDQQFDLTKDFNSFALTGGHLSISKRFNEVFGGEPYDYVLTKDTTKLDQNFENIIGKRNAYRDLLSSFQYQITVYGDTNLNIGQLIYLNLPESGTDELKGLSQYAGVYLITGLRHVVDRAKHNTVMNLTKDTLHLKHPKPGKA